MYRFAILALPCIILFFFIVLREGYYQTPLNLDYIRAIAEGDGRPTAYQLTYGMDGSVGYER